MDRTVNSYEDAHAKAYEILNLTQKLLDDNYAIIQFIKWSWEQDLDRQETLFHIKYRGFKFVVKKNDIDLFTAEWYQSAAESIAAWLLLQRGVRRGNNTRG